MDSKCFELTDLAWECWKSPGACLEEEQILEQVWRVFKISIESSWRLSKIFEKIIRKEAKGFLVKAENV